MRALSRLAAESTYGKEESKNGNNHETWYDVQAASLALYTGQRDVARTILEGSRARIDRHFEPDGRQPRELERTRSWDYSEFNLTAFFNLAALGEHDGVDLWNYTIGGRPQPAPRSRFHGAVRGRDPEVGRSIRSRRFAGARSRTCCVAARQRGRSRIPRARRQTRRRQHARAPSLRVALPAEAGSHTSRGVTFRGFRLQAEGPAGRTPNHQSAAECLAARIFTNDRPCSSVRREARLARFVERQRARAQPRGRRSSAAPARSPRRRRRRRRASPARPSRRSCAGARSPRARADEEERVDRGVARRQLRRMQVPALVEPVHQRMLHVVEVQLPRAVDDLAVLAALGLGQRTVRRRRGAAEPA